MYYLHYSKYEFPTLKTHQNEPFHDFKLRSLKMDLEIERRDVYPICHLTKFSHSGLF